MDKISLPIQLNIARSTILEVFPNNIKGIFTIGLENNTRVITDLVRLIEDISLKEKETFPDVYFNFESQMTGRRDKSPILSWEQFVNDCQHTVRENINDFTSKLINVFHLTGLAYVIPPPKSRSKFSLVPIPKKLIITDPIWLGNLYFTLSFAADRGLIKRGKLKLADLQEYIWSDPSVGVPKTGNYMDILIHFFYEQEILYPLPDTDDLFFPDFYQLVDRLYRVNGVNLWN